MAEKLTEARTRILRWMADGGSLERHWDVWGPKHTGGWDKPTWSLTADTERPSVIASLVAEKLVEEGPRQRVSSGHHVIAYSLTPSGRAVLERGE